MTKPKYQTNVKIQSSNDKRKVKNRGSKIKMTNQNVKNVVRGFSLVPGQARTTLKGRTTIRFGIDWVRLPRSRLPSLGGQVARNDILTPSLII
jgi:hypothetical protein